MLSKGQERHPSSIVGRAEEEEENPTRRTDECGGGSKQRGGDRLSRNREQEINHNSTPGRSMKSEMAKQTEGQRGQEVRERQLVKG